MSGSEADDAAGAAEAGPGGDWVRRALFARLDDAALADLAAAASERSVRAGEVLVRQGEPASALYFLRAGRFRVLVERPGGRDRQVAQIEAGEPMGELAFFAGGTRTATLVASRDSVVLELTREAFDSVAARHPAVLEALLREVSRRLADVTARSPVMSRRVPRVIALLGADDGDWPDALLHRLAAAIDRVSGGRRPVSCIGEDHPEAGERLRFEAWLHREEARGAWVLIDARGGQPWGMRACRNADLLLIVGSGTDAVLPGPVGKVAEECIWPENRMMALLRDRAADPPAGGAAWQAARDVHLVHHLAMDEDGDIARLARFLTGTAVGLVLAGGGALGCAHLGVIEGLHRAGIPIDYIGGTSAGAAMGGAVARGLTPAETLDQMEAMFIHAKAMRRLTLPVHSLLDPAVFDAELLGRYGAADIRDLPLPFFAISTNLSTNRLHVHRSGPLWEAVRASGSLPTILPPFVDSDGNVLVDGGVLDNVPVVTMRKLKTGTNIVVTLGEQQEAWRIRASYAELRRRGRLVSDLLLRRKRQDDFPSIIETMQRSMVVASRIASRAIESDTDIRIDPPMLPGMQILDWHKGREQAQVAQQHVEAMLEGDARLRALGALA